MRRGQIPRGGSGRRALAALAGLLALLAAARAEAEVRRYALLFGANRGQPHETPLRYAESDVGAVAATLTEVGGFASERIVRVVGARADRVRRALVDLGLAIQQDARAGHEAVLFVYYSGHADAQSLHLGGTELATEELAKLVRLAPARFKVLLLDACRTGALTRVKGGRQIPPLPVQVPPELRHEGLAIITSSTAGEDAQESDALRGSIFTHHFLTALRGPADTNRDLLVTLGEAYTYAYEQTLEDSMLTVVGSQHATFEYDLRGRADPVLADLRGRADGASLRLDVPGEYLVLDRESGSLLLEVAARAAGTEVRLPPGAYRVRLRTKRDVFEGALALRAGGRALVGPGDSRARSGDGAQVVVLRPLPLAAVVRKGETEARLAHGPLARATIHGPLAEGFSPMVGAQIGWAFELRGLTLLPRLGAARGRGGRGAEDVETHALTELLLELTALRVFDLGPLALAPLVSLGFTSLWQEIALGPACAEPVCSYTARPQAFLTALGGWAALPIGGGLSLEASLELASFYLRRQSAREAIGATAGLAGTVTYRAGLGLGYRY